MNETYLGYRFLQCFLLISASSGGGGSRGAPQHYPKTAGNRYCKDVKTMSCSNNRFVLIVFVVHNSVVMAVDIRNPHLTGHDFYHIT